MKRFREIYDGTPALDVDSQIINLCRMNPGSVPIAVIIGQYKGTKDGSEEREILRKVLLGFVPETMLDRM